MLCTKKVWYKKELQAWSKKKLLSQPKPPHCCWSHYLLPPFSWFPQVESKLWSSSSWACCTVQLWGVIGHLKEYWRSQKTLAHENRTERDCKEFQLLWVTLSMVALAVKLNLSDTTCCSLHTTICNLSSYTPLIFHPHQDVFLQNPSSVTILLPVISGLFWVNWWAHI